MKTYLTVTVGVRGTEISNCVMTCMHTLTLNRNQPSSLKTNFLEQENLSFLIPHRAQALLVFFKVLEDWRKKILKYESPFTWAYVSTLKIRHNWNREKNSKFLLFLSRSLFYLISIIHSKYTAEWRPCMQIDRLVSLTKPVKSSVIISPSLE